MRSPIYSTRQHLYEFIIAIENGGGSWEFIGERLTSWNRVLDNYEGVVSKENLKCLYDMAFRLHNISRLCLGLPLVQGRSIESIETANKEQRESIKLIKRDRKVIENRYKRLKMTLGKMDYEIGLDSEYKAFYLSNTSNTN